MAGRIRRWNQGLFPIDDTLIEQLIEDYHERAQGDAAAELDDDFAADGDCNPTWHLEEDLEAPTAAHVLEDTSEAATLDDARAECMRVLDDYLRRRIVEDPEPEPAPTLH